jgi:hypothetical protein
VNQSGGVHEIGYKLLRGLPENKGGGLHERSYSLFRIRWRAVAIGSLGLRVNHGGGVHERGRPAEVFLIHLWVGRGLSVIRLLRVLNF